MLQAAVFALLLIRRGFSKKQAQDFYLAGLLLALAASLISYFIGFMGIYDRAREEGWDLTYFPFGNPFLFAPLLWFYVGAVTDREHAWKNSDARHFLLPLLYYLRSFILWAQLYPVKVRWEERFGWETIAWDVVFYLSTIWYLWQSWKRLQSYRALLEREYSNIGKRALDWLRGVVLGFALYSLVDLTYNLIGLILNFSYAYWYWLELLRAGLLYALSVSGWGFAQKTDVSLQQLGHREAETIFAPDKTQSAKPLFSPEEMEIRRTALAGFMQREKPWLDPELTLSQLAGQTGLTPAQLSALVNTGFGKNFNDFVNEYRVEAVKRRLDEGAAKQFSLLGLAFESGFNSKATFNRAFKKHTGRTPGEFLNP
jgi:AraC-like DNA-binding protein